MRRLMLVTILIPMVIGSLFSQQKEWYIDKPIADNRFKGLRSITDNELFGLIRPYIGQKYSDTLSWGYSKANSMHWITLN